MPKLATKRRQEIIDHLVGNCDCGNDAQFDENDIEVLNKFSIEQLEKLMDDSEAEVPQEPTANVEPPKEPEKKEEPVSNEESKKFDESDLPESIREELSFARNMMQQKKDQLVSKITANKDCLFTKEELAGRSVDDLTKIASLVGNVKVDNQEDEEQPPKVTPRLGGHSASPTSNKKEEDWEVLDLPVMNFDLN